MDTPDTSVTLVRVIKAPPQEVFAAWTDRKSLQQWLARTAESDARSGGHYRLESIDRDGTLHVVTGEYKELVPGRRLVMTWGYAGPIAAMGVATSQLTVEFRPHGSAFTELSLKHEHISDARYGELLREGAWTAALDNLEAVCSGNVPERSGGVPDFIEREILIDAPVQRVWAVLTEARHIGTWFSDAGAEVDLRPGGAIELRWKEYGRFHARIERAEPPRFISWRGARSAQEEPREGNSTLVEFTLTPEGNQTRLRVVESGFSQLDLPEAKRAEHLAGNTQGWIIKLGELQAYVGQLP